MTPWQQAEFALRHGVGRVLFYGPPGTGKTYFGMNYMLNGKRSYRLVLTEDMTDGDLIGRYLPNEDKTLSFHEGVAIKAWREGARLVVDEINRANSDLESRLMSLIDTSGSASWEHPHTGEVLTPAPGFSVVATMNGEPDDLAPAVLDRLVVRMEITEPHPDAIQSLPDYIRALAQASVSKRGDDRYSLRNFVEFVTLYENSKDLEASAQICLPKIAEQLVDAISVRKVITGSVL